MRGKRAPWIDCLNQESLRAKIERRRLRRVWLLTASLFVNLLLSVVMLVLLVLIASSSQRRALSDTHPVRSEHK